MSVHRLESQKLSQGVLNKGMERLQCKTFDENSGDGEQLVVRLLWVQQEVEQNVKAVEKLETLRPKSVV